MRTRVNNELKTVATLVGDWGKWDDTYKFAKDHNKAYIKSNLAEEAITNIALDLMIFLDAKGRIIHQVYLDFDTGEMTELPAGLRKALEPKSELSERLLTGEASQGLIVIDDHPVLVADRPILTSAATGPSRGHLLFGRYLNRSLMNKFERHVAQEPVFLHFSAAWYAG